ncbi:hypothetical protein, conserved [Eimeria tenella]|uniref:Uncharacterized protein n=1 Tax=Eimeria tenella TaxID=5802 RepID=U6L1H7_EIMTE|nr:hypothetical protein, conserved [Eimeria tenella]CDJ43048.1 hypothetical protein, conserved [Eimeria tenella]|eukprot:XP_013233798.1 hypothetical protein, conserved [Eimeria tenella]
MEAPSGDTLVPLQRPHLLVIQRHKAYGINGRERHSASNDRCSKSSSETAASAIGKLAASFLPLHSPYPHPRGANEGARPPARPSPHGAQTAATAIVDTAAAAAAAVTAAAATAAAAAATAATRCTITRAAYAAAHSCSTHNWSCPVRSVDHGPQAGSDVPEGSVRLPPRPRVLQQETGQTVAVQSRGTLCGQSEPANMAGRMPDSCPKVAVAAAAAAAELQTPCDRRCGNKNSGSSSRSRSSDGIRAGSRSSWHYMLRPQQLWRKKQQQQQEKQERVCRAVSDYGSCHGCCSSTCRSSLTIKPQQELSARLTSRSGGLSTAAAVSAPAAAAAVGDSPSPVVAVSTAAGHNLGKRHSAEAEAAVEPPARPVSPASACCGQLVLSSTKWGPQLLQSNWGAQLRLAADTSCRSGHRDRSPTATQRSSSTGSCNCNSGNRNRAATTTTKLVATTTVLRAKHGDLEVPASRVPPNVVKQPPNQQSRLQCLENSRHHRMRMKEQRVQEQQEEYQQEHLQPREEQQLQKLLQHPQKLRQHNMRKQQQNGLQQHCIVADVLCTTEDKARSRCTSKQQQSPQLLYEPQQQQQLQITALEGTENTTGSENLKAAAEKVVPAAATATESTTVASSVAACACGEATAVDVATPAPVASSAPPSEPANKEADLCAQGRRTHEKKPQQHQPKERRQLKQLLQQRHLYATIVVERMCRVLHRSACRRSFRLLLMHAVQQHALQPKLIHQLEQQCQPKQQQQPQQQQQQEQLQQKQWQQLQQRSQWIDADLQSLSLHDEVISRETFMRLEDYRRRLRLQQIRLKHEQQQQKQQQQQQQKRQQQLIQQLATAAQELKKANDQQEALQGRLATALSRLQHLEQQQHQLQPR